MKYYIKQKIIETFWLWVKLGIFGTIAISFTYSVGMAMTFFGINQWLRLATVLIIILPGSIGLTTVMCKHLPGGLNNTF